MKVRVKISREIKDYYDQYGSLSYCVNRLLRSMDDIWIGAPTVACSDEKDLCWTTVDVNSPVYDALRQSYGDKSKLISLSRLLAFAHEIDFCNGWEKRSELTTTLEHVSKLSDDELKNLINILNERYKK